MVAEWVGEWAAAACDPCHMIAPRLHAEAAAAATGVARLRTSHATAAAEAEAEAEAPVAAAEAAAVATPHVAAGALTFMSISQKTTRRFLSLIIHRLYILVMPIITCFIFSALVCTRTFVS